MSGAVADTRAISRDLFSATIGSVFCAYVGQPFDTVKVRMQTNPDHYTGVVTSTTGIIRNEVNSKSHDHLTADRQPIIK
jgi:hypothetical protein